MAVLLPVFMLIVVSAIAFFVLITGLVLVHEFGHFIAARKAGVIVEEFGIGLPPRAKELFEWRGTLFSLNWIPFGGFVRLKGEGALDERERKAKGSFASASILARCIILLAGVTMNFLLALVIFFFGFSFGRWIPTYLTLDEMEQAAARQEIHLKLGVVVDDVLAGGGAADAHLPVGFVITAVDGQPVTHPADVLADQQGKKAVTYALSDPKKKLPDQTIRVQVQQGKTGVYLRAAPLELSAPTRGPLQAVALSLREAKVVTEQTVVGIAKLFISLTRSGRVPEGVTGIVGIAQLTYVSVQEGFMVYLRLVALLSLSLAVLNVLPFPALDGGRMIFVLSELFLRRSHRKVEMITNTVGFGILLLVILLVTFYDVFRLFS